MHDVETRGDANLFSGTRARIMKISRLMRGVGRQLNALPGQAENVALDFGVELLRDLASRALSHRERLMWFRT